MPDLNLGMFSVVVLAEFHNPSILTKDYLANLDLIKPDEVTNFIHTPAASLVEFGSCQFLVEPGRMEVRQVENSMNIKTSRVPDVAKAYTQKLPETPYKATGLNFRASAEFESPKIRNKLFSALLSKDFQPIHLPPFSNALFGLRFLYRDSLGRHTITIEPEYEEQSPKVNLRYSIHVEKTPGPDEIISVVDSSRELYEEFKEKVSVFLKEI